MKKYDSIKEKSLDLTTRIIDETGPRLAGTKASIDSAELLGKELEMFADKVSLDSFDIHKGAFLGWIKILVVSYFIGVIILWFNLPIIAGVIAMISILILILQFFFYLPIIDMFYPKKEAMNVVGFIEPKEDVKQQIIISGHHDSARIFNFFIHQPKLYNLRVTGSILLVILLVVLSLVSIFIKSPLTITIINIFLSVGILLIAQMWFFASKKGTPGAGDNLLASCLAVELGRYYCQNKLKNTRIIVASFDAEEEGLRGARAFSKKYKDLLHEYPTTLLNMDCLYQLDEIFFLTSDINNTVKMDESLAIELTEIARDLGYHATHKPIAFLTGGTDAGELAKIGVSATTLIAMPWSNESRSSVYHTPNDTLDKVEIALVDAIIEIYITYINKRK